MLQSCLAAEVRVVKVALLGCIVAALAWGGKGVTEAGVGGWFDGGDPLREVLEVVLGWLKYAETLYVEVLVKRVADAEAAWVRGLWNVFTSHTFTMSSVGMSVALVARSVLSSGTGAMIATLKRLAGSSVVAQTAVKAAETTAENLAAAANSSTAYQTASAAAPHP